MVTTLLKSTLREIRQSLGRYLAILAIVGLGVGFFAGLRMAQPDMMATGVAYLEEYQLFDFQLMSTLGFTKEDVEAFSQLEGISAAEGSVYTDFLMERGENDEIVVTARSLTTDINQTELLAGRMPEAANECVGDSRFFTEEDLGTAVRVSSNNDEDTRELMAYDEYTLVGLVQSPYYLNYERGTSSIGSGSVSAFVYIPEDGFDFDAYYEMYLSIADGADAYSDAYEDQIDNLKPQVEELLDQRAELRYETLYNDAMEEILDAEAELADGWEEYRSERSDAELELSDALQELLDGEADYAQGVKDYEQGKIDYADGLQEYEDGLQEIADAEQELKDGWQEYYDGKAEAEQELRDAYQELLDAEADYADGLAEYEDGLKELQDAEAEYEDGLSELEDARDQLDDAEAELEAGWEKLQDAKDQLEEGEAQYAQLQELYQAGEQLAGELSSMTGISDPSTLVGYISSLSPDNPIYIGIDQALQAQGSSVDEFVGGRQAAESQLGGTLNDATLQGLRDELDQGRVEYEEGLVEYEDGVAQYEDGLAQYREGRDELEDAREQLDDAWAELDEGKQELDDGRAELDDGWREYYEGAAEAEQELADAYQELLDGEQELADGKQELEDAKIELEDAKADLDAAPGELEDARQELDDGWREYYDGEAEADREFLDAETELSDAERELADAREDLKDLKRADTYTLTRNENIGYVCFDNDTSIVKAISVVFPVFFFLVAALVCMTTMTRMVDEQRTQIGVLKAMGYGNGQIMGKYLFYSGSAAVIGSTVGYAVGAHWMPWIIWEIYGIIYGFAELTFVFDPALAAVSFAAALLCSMGATFLSCRVELTKAAAELIRPKAPKAGRRVFLEYITPLWRRLSFLHKVSIRNVLRYRSRLIMMVLGIGGCTALLVTGFGLRDSIKSVVDDQYAEITLFDYNVSFQDPQDEESVAEYLAACGWEEEKSLLVHNGSVDIRTEGNSKSVNLVVSASNTLDGFISLHSGERAIEYPASGEVVVNVGLAENMGLSVGDTVTLRDDDVGTLTVTISDICDNYVYNYVYVSPDTYLDQLHEEPEYKNLYLLGHEGADPYQEGAVLSEDDAVSNVAISEATRSQVDSMLTRMDYIVVVVVVCAGALAFIVLYNLTNINITERIREIATIEVLGFYQNETASYVFREIFMLSALGSLVGLLMGKGLHAFVMAQVQIDAMYFPSRVDPISYLYALALTLVFTLVIFLSLKPRLRKIDMAESLKSIE